MPSNLAPNPGFQQHKPRKNRSGELSGGVPASVRFKSSTKKRKTSQSEAWSVAVSLVKSTIIGL